MDELLASVRASDPLGLLAVLHPDERHLVDTLYSNSSGAAEANGAVDVDALLRALHVDITTERLQVEQLSDRLAWVTTSRVGVSAWVDVEQLDVAVAADLSDVDSPDVFEDTLEPSVDDLGIAVVNEGGQWFVSALYTAAELARRDLGLQPLFAAGQTPPAKNGTPEEAVTALALAVSNQDTQAVAGALSPFEGRLVADYEATLGAELIEELEGLDLAVEPTNVHVVEQSTDWAIVEVDRWSVGVSGVDDYGDESGATLTVDGLCGEYRQWDSFDGGYESSDVDGACAFTEDSMLNVFSILAGDGWRGPRFVVVNQDGAWSVSLLQSVLQSVAPFTTDAVTAAAVIEALAGGDGFYEPALTFLASGLAPLPAGTTTKVPTQGHGRVAMFRVEAGVEVSLDIQPGGHDVCHVAVFDPGFGEFTTGFECNETSGPIEVDSFLLVTTSNRTAFSALEPLGEVTVTVTAF